jgi:branched-chain amino acid transport system substrate-binding protein
MVGWLSGIGGYNSGPIRDGLAAWSKAVNAKGGINGHPVQLLIGDDGGNESKSVSIVRDFVENKHAIAIVGYSGGSAVAVSNYAKSKNVPLIGGLVIEQLWTQNPMMFPNVAATDAHFWGTAKLAADAGVKKVATVYCTEVAACQQSNDVFVQQAQQAGLQVVYQGKISFTQPDYTAECLQMKNSGAEAVVPITENNSSIRLAQSCGRQGFKPKWMLSVGNDSMAQIPEFERAIATLVGFPWFIQSGSAALDEYAQAIKQYAPDRAASGVDWQTSGWTAGKLFEKAAQGVSDQPSSQEILDGLWKFKAETLGGLVAPRTFNRGQPVGETFCVYEAIVQGSKWAAPHGMQAVCK